MKTSSRFVCLVIVATTCFFGPVIYAKKFEQNSLTKLKFFKSACSKPCLADSGKVMLLLAVGKSLISNKPDSSLLLYHQALQLSNKINWAPGVAFSYLLSGDINVAKGSHKIAIDYYARSIKIWKDLEKNNSTSDVFFSNQRAIAISKIADVYYILKNYNESAIWFARALHIAKANEYSSLSITLRKELGSIYLIKGDTANALNYYESALKEKATKTDNLILGEVYENIGNIYKARRKYSAAKTNYTNAKKFYVRSNNKSAHSRIESKLGDIYNTEENYLKSTRHHSKALKLSKETKDLNLEAISNEKIAVNSLSLNQYSKGQKYLLGASSVKSRIDSLESIRETQRNLILSYERIGNYKKAFEENKKYRFTEDTINALFVYHKQLEVENKLLIVASEQKRKDQKIRAEISKQKIIRNAIAGGAGVLGLSFFFSFLFYKRKRDAEIRFKVQVSETEMKALRSQMNPHFIFNALQSIQTFLMSHKPDDANVYLLKFSKLMRAVLENSQYHQISLQKDMQALELYMQLESIRLKHSFTYEFHIDKTIDVENDTIPPLILQPLVENAIWHGLQHKAESGHINIYISKKSNELHAIVEDNGVGRSLCKQAQPLLFMKKESLGMKLTEERLKVFNELNKTKAQFKITDLFTKDNKPAGTKVELSLPLIV